MSIVVSECSHKAGAFKKRAAVSRAEEDAKDTLARWTDHLEKLVASDLATHGMEAFITGSFRTLQLGSIFVATETTFFVSVFIFDLTDPDNGVQVGHVSRLHFDKPEGAEEVSVGGLFR